MSADGGVSSCAGRGVPWRSPPPSAARRSGFPSGAPWPCSGPRGPLARWARGRQGRERGRRAPLGLWPEFRGPGAPRFPELGGRCSGRPGPRAVRAAARSGFLPAQAGLAGWVSPAPTLGAPGRAVTETVWKIGHRFPRAPTPDSGGRHRPPPRAREGRPVLSSCSQRRGGAAEGAGLAPPQPLGRSRGHARPLPRSSPARMWCRVACALGTPEGELGPGHPLVGAFARTRGGRRAVDFIWGPRAPCSAFGIDPSGI